jgi:hypothetical protein
MELQSIFCPVLGHHTGKVVHIVQLGIVVVYFVKEENEELLKLHLSQIERYTTVPYKVYASVNRLVPKFSDYVSSARNTKICDCPTTELRGDNEQIYYLEHLINEAIKDGATHIGILHVDSFPIRSDWAQVLAAKLSDTCGFAIPYYGNYTSCLFFTSEFYLKYRPEFILTREEFSSREYRQFCRNFPHIPHAGIGFFWKAYRENLTWFPLTESKKRSAQYVFHSNIYDDVVFHLNAAASPETGPHENLHGMKAKKWLFAYLWVPIFRVILYSKDQQRALRWRYFRIVRRLLSWSWRHIGDPVFYKPINWHERGLLLANPEAFIESTRRHLANGAPGFGQSVE